MKKLLIRCLASLVLTGCASQWMHPTADQYTFQRDIAQCEVYAQSAVPDTSAQYNPNLTPGQQAGQYASNAGSQLGRVFGLRMQFNNCMVAKGYAKQ